MHQWDSQQVEHGHLGCGLKRVRIVELHVHVNAGGQLLQDGEHVADVLLVVRCVGCGGLIVLAALQQQVDNRSDEVTLQYSSTAVQQQVMVIVLPSLVRVEHVLQTTAGMLPKLLAAAVLVGLCTKPLHMRGWVQGD